AADGERPWREGDAWPRAWPHEELLFIVTHQTFELWFKQVLHDLDDVLATAAALVGSRGAQIPASDLAGRQPSDAPPLAGVLSCYPCTERLIKQTLSGNAWERRWVQELHQPGVFPRRGAALVGALELGWFDEATLMLFARRVGRAARILR